MSLTQLDFPFAANWSQPITERLEWKTDILRSTSGAEQRRAIRYYPRRSLEFTLMLAGGQRQKFENAVARGGAGDWIVPLYHDARHLLFPMSAESPYIIIVEYGYTPEMAVGSYVLLHDKRTERWGRYKVSTADANGIINLTDGPYMDWPAGTTVYPTFLGRLTDQPDKARHTDGAYLATVRFDDRTPPPFTGDNEVAPTDNFSSSAEGYTDSYRGNALLRRPPEESERLPSKNEFQTTDLENDVAFSHRVLTGPLGVETRQHRWWLKGRFRYRAFKQFLFDLRGQANHLWLPTFSQDFTLAQDPLAGTQYITVQNSGYREAGFPIENRQDILIEMMDGSFLGRRITGTAWGPGDTEVLILDQFFGSGFPKEAVKRVSLMGLARLAQDAVELNHPTDVTGVTTCMTTFRLTPPLRVVSAGFP